MHGRNELEEKHTSKLLIFLKLVRLWWRSMKSSGRLQRALVQANATPCASCFVLSVSEHWTSFVDRRSLARTWLCIPVEALAGSACACEGTRERDRESVHRAYLGCSCE